jgi:hypothetical protein
VLRATLRKCYRDLPVVSDELDDALEPHDAEEMAASPAPHRDDKAEAELYPLRIAVRRQLKYSK